MNVVFLDTVHEVLAERLTQAGFNCIDASSEPLEKCLFLVKNAAGLVIRSRFPMNEEFLKQAPELQFIARSGAGMENIDLAYCQARNIHLFNAPEGNRNAVAEHALGMLLSLFNKLQKSDREVRNGIWDREGNRGIELDRKTVGIIGFGNNGSAFAKKLKGFDVQILAYDKYKTVAETGQVKAADLKEIYAKADVISFHIPQNAETLFWANETFFEALQKPMYLLNLSRGKIVEIQALLKAISSGKILGAGLDVLEFEKASFEQMDEADLPESFKALIQSDKVLLTPHVGGWTVESYFKLSAVLADKILNWKKSNRN